MFRLSRLVYIVFMLAFVWINLFPRIVECDTISEAWELWKLSMKFLIEEFITNERAEA